MPSNPEMSKFLYTIVKQLDLKSVGVPSLLLFSTTLLSSRYTRRKIFRLLCLEVSPWLKYEIRLTGTKCLASWA